MTWGRQAAGRASVVPPRLPAGAEGIEAQPVMLYSPDTGLYGNGAGAPASAMVQNSKRVIQPVPREALLCLVSTLPIRSGCH